MSNPVKASASIQMASRVLNASTVYHQAALGILIGLDVPTFATLVGRIGVGAGGTVLRSSAHVFIRAHMQVPQVTGYSIGSVGGRAAVAAVPTVLRGARVSINPTGRLSDASQTASRTTVGVTARVAVTARPAAGVSGTILIRTSAGIADRASVVVSSADVIRMAIGVVAKAFPAYAIRIRIGMGVGVVAHGVVPQSTESASCQIGMRIWSIRTAGTIRSQAADHLQVGTVVKAVPLVTRQATVKIQMGLRTQAVARNLIGAGVGIAVTGVVRPNEGRGTYGKAAVGVRSGIVAHATILTRGSAAIWVGASVILGDTALRGGRVTIEAAVRVLVGMIRTARGVSQVQTGITVQASGERNSLGGIQSTVTPTNPKGTVTQLGPTSTISVIP